MESQGDLSPLMSAGAGVVAVAWLAGGPAAQGQTDEIQVYDATINDPGQFSVELHNNYTLIGRTQPDFPGKIAPTMR
jgi:hypothetical protein